MQPICPDDFITEQNELILYPKEQKHKTIYGEKDWHSTWGSTKLVRSSYAAYRMLKIYRKYTQCLPETVLMMFCVLT